MKPLEFKEQTKILHRPNIMTDEECRPLPIFSDGKSCISCWQPTWRERLAILFYGKVWLSVRSGNTQPPVWLRGYKTAFERKELKPDNKSILKCNFCDWQIQKWKTTKKGKRVHLYGALQSHVMMNHPEEYQKIQDKLEGE